MDCILIWHALLLKAPISHGDQWLLLDGNPRSGSQHGRFSALCSPCPAPFIILFVVLLARNSGSWRQDGSAALPAPESLPGAISEHFQELLVDCLSATELFLMGIKSQEVKEHVVLQAAGEIFPSTWSKHRVFHQEQGALKTVSLHTRLALADLPAEPIKTLYRGTAASSSSESDTADTSPAKWGCLNSHQRAISTAKFTSQPPDSLLASFSYSLSHRTGKFHAGMWIHGTFSHPLTVGEAVLGPVLR